jgi:hypothetical protein
MTVKFKTLWQVRYYPDHHPMACSEHVGHKGKIVSIDRARAAVKRLKKAKVKAFRVPFKVFDKVV